MAAASDLTSSERQFSRRAIAFAVVVAVHLLLGLLLYLAAPRLRLPPGVLPPIVVTLLPSLSPEPAPAPRPQAKAAAKAPAAKPAPKVPKPVKKRLEDYKLPIIVVSRADLARSDIAGIPSVAPAATADAGTGKSDGHDGDSEFVEGGAPGGQRLYKAEWFREPRPAEINGYMHQGTPEGSWGAIACKTVEHYHVEDCQELDEGPRGSGIARSLRQAAWQFLVRPPRIGGKELFGAWVSIRIDFTKDAAG